MSFHFLNISCCLSIIKYLGKFLVVCYNFVQLLLALLCDQNTLCRCYAATRNRQFYIQMLDKKLNDDCIPGSRKRGRGTEEK